MEETIDTEGLVLWLPRNISDQWYDLSGEENEGIIYDTSIVSLLCEECMSFNGISSYVNCGNKDSLNIVDAFTIEVWAKITGQGWQHISGKRELQSTWIRLAMNDEEKLCLELAENYPTNPLNKAISAQVINDNIWHHLVALRDGNDLKLYIDGIPDGTGSSSYNPSNTAKYLIGSFTITGMNLLNGSIGELRMYNRTLTSEEIRRTYETTKKYYGF